MPQAVLAIRPMEFGTAHTVTVSVHDEITRALDSSAFYPSCSKRARTVMTDVTKHANIERSLSHQQASSSAHNAKPSSQSSAAILDGQQAQKRKVAGPTTTACLAGQKSTTDEEERRELLQMLLKSEDTYLLKSAPVETGVNAAMRVLLVDWLGEGWQEFKCSAETAHLGVAILDRYIHCRAVSMPDFQLVGITALWIAMKYEELNPRNAYECIDMTDCSYSLEGIREMEIQILNAMDFKLSQPTSPQFLDIFSLSSGLQDKTVIALAHYLSELVLLHGLNTRYRPSEIAAAALYVATSTVHSDPVPRRLLRATPYTLEQLTPAIKDISLLHEAACSPLCDTQLKAKYSKAAHYHVAAVYVHQPYPVRTTRSAVVTRKGVVVLAPSRAI